MTGLAPDSADTCFTNGYYTLVGNDAYGDGWDNAYLTITNSGGDTLLNFTINNGYADTAMFYVGPLYGCMDPYANNYNPYANIDDGSCNYTTCELNETRFHCSEGYWAAEVGWYVEDSVGTVVANGVALVGVSGTASTVAQGDETVTCDANVYPTTVAGTGAISSLTIQTQNVVSITGLAGTTELGDLTARIPKVVSITGVLGTSKLGGLLVWSPVAPDQTPNWTDAGASQSPSYSTISPSQSPDWKDEAA